MEHVASTLATEYIASATAVTDTVATAGTRAVGRTSRRPKAKVDEAVDLYVKYSRTNDYVKLWLRHCVQLYAQQHHA